MKVTTLKEPHIEAIMADLWQRGVDELRDFGQEKADTAALFASMAGEPFSTAFLSADGIPCAMLAMVPTGPGRFRTHFCATETGFKKIWLELTRFLSGSSKHLVDHGAEIEILSNQGAGKTFDWFLCMGFQYGGQDGNVHRYYRR